MRDRPASEEEEAHLRERLNSAAKSRVHTYPREQLQRLIDDARTLRDLLDWERRGRQFEDDGFNEPNVEQRLRRWMEDPASSEPGARYVLSRALANELLDRIAADRTQTAYQVAGRWQEIVTAKSVEIERLREAIETAERQIRAGDDAGQAAQALRAALGAADGDG